jgi:DNA modification methylase
MQQLAVTYRATAALVPYAQNSRTHSDLQIAQIAAAIKEWGWTNPILCDEAGEIIAGHGRLMAAQKLGMAEVPTITIEGLTPEQRRALVIADNKLAENAGWDMNLLRLELADLNMANFDLGLIGFSVDELDKLLAPLGTEGNTDPDDVPPTPDFPVAVAGDVWVLGRHRLVCGDSTSVEAVNKALNGVKPHLMVTDPPYGVEYDPDWRSKALKDGAKRAEGKVQNDDRADWREAWALFPGDVAYVWHGMIHAHTVADSLIAAGFKIRAQIVWAKSRMVLSRGHYHPQHESAWYVVRDGATGHWAGDRSQTTVWQIDHAKSDTGHGTQKPVDAMKRPIENNSSPGHAIYEPFSGSGTTIIACEMTGRTCHAIELEPAYVDVGVLRWQAFTGKHAVLESDGRTFTEVMGERAPGKLVGNEQGKQDKVSAKAKKSQKPKASKNGDAGGA